MSPNRVAELRAEMLTILQRIAEIEAQLGDQATPALHVIPGGAQ